MSDDVLLTVNLDVLSAAVDRMATLERSVVAQIDELDSRARQVAGTWTGTAADEYAAAHRKWTVGAYELHEALGVLRQIASTAHANYSGAAAANRSMWCLR